MRKVSKKHLVITDDFPIKASSRKITNFWDVKLRDYIDSFLLDRKSNQTHKVHSSEIYNGIRCVNEHLYNVWWGLVNLNKFLEES